MGYTWPCYELLWPKMTQNIHTITNYDLKYGKLFYEDQK